MGRALAVQKAPRLGRFFGIATGIVALAVGLFWLGTGILNVLDDRYGPARVVDTNFAIGLPSRLRSIALGNW